MANKLDLDKQIVNKDGKPTAYLEDIISEIIDALGGETALSVPDQLALAVNPMLLAQIKASR